MKILAVNAGSSSLKFQVLEMPEEIEISSGLVERIGNQDAAFTMKFNGNKQKDVLPVLNHAYAVKLVLDGLIKHQVIQSYDEIKGVGHRVVQGGEVFKDSVLITDEVVAQIEALNYLAPLHNPANVVGINSFREVLPNVKHVAVFDTVFHSTIPDVNYFYATPYEWYQKYGLRKYGFHGTSHQYVSQRAIELLGKKDSKIIVCHIGNGASIAAVRDGKCIDTSMGLTPLEGIPMGTRSGNIDPTVFQLLKEKEGYSVEQILDILNKKSGYLGISGFSHDSRDLEDAAATGNHRAQLALDIQAKRIADYIGSYYLLLEGLDAICFTAGIGENASSFRQRVCDRLKAIGIKLDPIENKKRSEALISTADSKVKVYIIPTNEEVMIARDVIRLQNQ